MICRAAGLASPPRVSACVCREVLPLLPAGRAAQAQGQSCEYSLMVGYQCGLVFRACCVKGQEIAEFAPRGRRGPSKKQVSPPFFPLGQGSQSRLFREAEAIRCGERGREFKTLAHITRGWQV